MDVFAKSSGALSACYTFNIYLHTHFLLRALVYFVNVILSIYIYKHTHAHTYTNLCCVYTVEVALWFTP
jgi:hypothetical protein